MRPHPPFPGTCIASLGLIATSSQTDLVRELVFMLHAVRIADWGIRSTDTILISNLGMHKEMGKVRIKLGHK